MVYDPLVTFKFMLPFMKNNSKKRNEIDNNSKANNNSETITYMHSSSVIDKHTLDSIAKYMNLTKGEVKTEQENIENVLEIQKLMRLIKKRKKKWQCQKSKENYYIIMKKMMK